MNSVIPFGVPLKPLEKGYTPPSPPPSPAKKTPSWETSSLIAALPSNFAFGGLIKTNLFRGTSLGGVVANGRLLRAQLGDPPSTFEPPTASDL